MKVVQYVKYKTKYKCYFYTPVIDGWYYGRAQCVCLFVTQYLVG